MRGSITVVKRGLIRPGKNREIRVEYNVTRNKGGDVAVTGRKTRNLHHKNKTEGQYSGTSTRKEKDFTVKRRKKGSHIGKINRRRSTSEEVLSEETVTTEGYNTKVLWYMEMECLGSVNVKT